MADYTIIENNFNNTAEIVPSTSHTVISLGTQGPSGAPILSGSGVPSTSHSTAQIYLRTSTPPTLWYYDPNSDAWTVLVYIPN